MYGKTGLSVYLLLTLLIAVGGFGVRYIDYSYGKSVSRTRKLTIAVIIVCRLSTVECLALILFIYFFLKKDTITIVHN